MSLGKWLEYRIFAGLLAQLRSDDLMEAREKGAALGRKLYALDPKWKHIAIRQVHERLGHPDPEMLVRRNYEHYGMVLAEIACFESLHSSASACFEYSGREHFEAIKDGGLAISAHLGNWELMGLDQVRHFPNQVAALVKPIGNRYIEHDINQTRAAYGIRTVTTRDNALTVRKLLKQKHVVVTLADQNSLYREGVFVPFMGRPASTHYGPAMLAIRAGVPVITAFCHRTPEGFHITCGPPLEYDKSLPLREATWLLTRDLTARVEAAVRAHPEQWFWVHRRWKNQPRPQDPDWVYGPEGRGWAEK